MGERASPSFRRNSSNPPTKSNLPTRGLLILIPHLTAREHNRFLLLCHCFAIVRIAIGKMNPATGKERMAPLRPSTSVVSTTACEHGLPSDAPPLLRSLSAELNPE